jgi:hypothetical protein
MVKKESVKKETHHQYSDLEKTLVENFVSLQKVLVHLSSKFDDLSGNIAKLLELFEISAKTLAEKELSNTSISDEETTKEIKRVSEKLNNLLDQNKIIARGLTLMYDKFSGSQPMQMQNPIPKPLPRMSPPTPSQDISEKPVSFSEYQKSISG